MHSNELLWEADFSNRNTLEKDWNIESVPPRHVNNELQRYSHDTFKFENNELIIETIKNNHDIKSGRINTKGKIEFQYGYIKGLMKFSGNKGLWPAFWMLGNTNHWPHCGEIDIMEVVTWNPYACYGTLHGGGYCGGNGYGNNGNKKINEPLANNYHKYAIEWTPNYINWFLDDQLYFTATINDLHTHRNNSHWLFNDHPFYLILNNAVGGNFGGAFNDSENYIYNNLPNYNEFRIKYIKIYKTKDGYGRVIRY